MQLEVKGINKSFGEKQVLKDIAISVSGGQALGLLGRNGAGKTTMIRIIMGVFGADGGSVLLDGKPIDRSRVKLGYLPEERGLYPKKIISRQLAYLGALKGMTPSETKEATERLLGRLEMTEYINKKLEVLSKGNQQKIQLAVALLNDPDILILDEPFSGLDPVNAMLLKDIVMEMIEKGKIVLFSSH
jgi:ABC-2 type transport system ATP-binding protein